MAIKEYYDTFTVSQCEEDRKNGHVKHVHVTYRFVDWSEEDYIARMFMSNSIRVAVQAKLRAMKEIPDSYVYIVPKSGTRARISSPHDIVNAFGGDIDRAIAELERMKSKSE